MSSLMYETVVVEGTNERVTLRYLLDRLMLANGGKGSEYFIAFMHADQSTPFNACICKETSSMGAEELVRFQFTSAELILELDS